MNQKVWFHIWKKYSFLTGVYVSSQALWLIIQHYLYHFASFFAETHLRYFSTLAWLLTSLQLVVFDGIFPYLLAFFFRWILEWMLQSLTIIMEWFHKTWLKAVMLTTSLLSEFDMTVAECLTLLLMLHNTLMEWCVY